MRVDRDLFMDQGYLVIPGIIPPDKLDTMRASCETILERQKVVWARERQPGDPPGGQWETARQPRVMMERPGLIDEETANVVEDFWVADRTLDICNQLLCNPEPNVMQMMMMCSPVRDHPGGTGWHRDVHPIDMAPLQALQADFLENGPRYTQWNVPMYDDNVLWVIPGSHRRLNTAQENAELSADRMKAVTGGVPVELRAGDGVIYSNFLIHWGSDYTTKLRRTLHGGHAIFGHYPGAWLRREPGTLGAGAVREHGSAQRPPAGPHGGRPARGHRPRRSGLPRQFGGAPTGRRRERQDGADDLPVQGGDPPARPENP